MSYWLVISIVACAAVATALVLIWSLRPPSVAPGRRRWVALGMSGIGPAERRSSWVAALHEQVPGIECIDLTASGATASDVRHNQLGTALSAQPIVAVIWVGLEDALSGVAPARFRQDLSFVLDQLARQRCHVIVVGLPALAPESVGRGRRASSGRIKRLTEAWAAELQSVSEAYRASSISLPGPGGEAVAPKTFTPQGSLFEREALDDLARRVAPVLRRLVRTAPPDWTPDEPWEQPQDPVQRRERGMPLF